MVTKNLVVILLPFFLSCGSVSVLEQPARDPGLVFIPWVRAAAVPDIGNYHVFPGNRVPPDRYLAVKLKLVNEAKYFFADGRGKVSKLLSSYQEAYYQVKWKISKLGEVISLIGNTGAIQEDRFTSLDAKGLPLAAGKQHSGAIAFFHVGEQLNAGKYLLSVAVDDGDPGGQILLYKFQQEFEVLGPFQLPDGLRLGARGGAVRGHTVLDTEPSIQQLAEVPVYNAIISGDPRAIATLHLRVSAASTQKEVFYYNFYLAGDKNYRITRYRGPSLGTDPITKVTSTADTPSVQLTGNLQNPKPGDFPLEQEGYAAWFTAKFSGGQLSSEQGKVELEIQDQYSRKGILNVYLSAGI